MQVNLYYLFLGQDVTKMFISVGHSKEAQKLMKKYVIGRSITSDFETTETVIKETKGQTKHIVMISLFILFVALFIILILLKS